MSKFANFSLVIISILALLANSGCRKPAPRDEYASGEIILKFKGDTWPQSIKSLNDRFGLIRIERLAKDTFMLEFPNDSDMEKLVGEYSKDPFVEYAEPNYIVRAVDK